MGSEISIRDRKGLLKGIWEGLKSIDTWLKENVFEPFINGFKKVFGIASPSKVMAEQGGFIVSGLLGGLVDNIGSVWKWVQGIPEKLTGFFKDLPNSFLQIGENIISGLWNGIKNTWDSLSSGLKEIGSGIVNTFKNVLDIHSPSRVMFELGDYTMQGFQDGLENLYKPILSSVKAFGQDLQIAPAPSLTDMHRSYQYTATSYAPLHESLECMQSTGYNQSNAETNALLRQQNELLRAILAKPNIENNDIFNAAKTVYKGEAMRRYGNSTVFDPIWG